MSNYANICCCSCTQPSRGITSYEEIGQKLVYLNHVPSRGLRAILFRVFRVFRIRITLFVEAVHRSVSHRILHIYVLYTRVIRGRDRLTCIIAKKRMFTRWFFFPDTAAAADGMTSCTYVIFVLARLPAAVYNINRYNNII